MSVLELSSPTIDVGLVCSDFGASLEFYRDRLGLAVAYDLVIPDRLAVPSGLAPSGFRHVRLRAGNTLIKLMEIEPAPEPGRSAFAGGVRWLTFFVTDLAETVQRLRARGIEFISDPIQGLAGSFACAQAPDGILLEFVELYVDAGS